MLRFFAVPCALGSGGVDAACNRMLYCCNGKRVYEINLHRIVSCNPLQKLMLLLPMQIDVSHNYAPAVFPPGRNLFKNT